MVEFGRLPTFGGVALDAILPEAASVRVVLHVARITILLRGLQIGQGTRGGMAFGAIQRSMFALQGESKAVVVETFAVSVQPIVTSQAILPKSGSMPLEKDRVQVAVAARTNCLIRLRKAFCVAIRTGERSTSGHLLVGAQRKTHRRVRKIVQIGDGQGGIGTIMVGVTAMTETPLAFGQHDAMEIQRVSGQIGVAGQTAVGHAFAAPKGRVAGRATGDLSVGENAAQQIVALIVERARTKQHAAARQSCANDDEQRDQGGDETRSGEAAETFHRRFSIVDFGF